MASHPGRWDWVAAQIPSPLTAEMEQAKREKAKARKKVKKENESKKVCSAVVVGSFITNVYLRRDSRKRLLPAKSKQWKTSLIGKRERWRLKSGLRSNFRRHPK